MTSFVERPQTVVGDEGLHILMILTLISKTPLLESNDQRWTAVGSTLEPKKVFLDVR